MRLRARLYRSVSWCVYCCLYGLPRYIALEIEELNRDTAHNQPQPFNQRNEKISNNSSFGIIDIAEHSSTSDRIIVIVDTACFIHDGAYR